jgi:hypothetical protein
MALRWRAFHPDILQADGSKKDVLKGDRAAISFWVELSRDPGS